MLGKERAVSRNSSNLVPEHRLKEKMGIFQLCGERGIPNDRIKGMEVLDSGGKYRELHLIIALEHNAQRENTWNKIKLLQWPSWAELCFFRLSSE